MVEVDCQPRSHSSNHVVITELQRQEDHSIDQIQNTAILLRWMKIKSSSNVNKTCVEKKIKIIKITHCLSISNFYVCHPVVLDL